MGKQYRPRLSDEEWELVQRHRGVRVNSSKSQVVGVVGDLHAPFIREGYIKFCYDTFQRQGVTHVVFAGDIIDNHVWSRHLSEADAHGGLDEFELAKKCVTDIRDLFSCWECTWIVGNHDAIPMRQVNSIGLPSMLIKSLQELYEVDWEVCPSRVIDNVKYVHGIGCANILLTAQRMRCSVVAGHFHSRACIQSHANHDDLIFGMQVGAGVEDKAYAMRYAKESLHKSVISCATVYGGRDPQLHFMPL